VVERLFRQKLVAPLLARNGQKKPNSQNQNSFLRRMCFTLIKTMQITPELEVAIQGLYQAFPSRQLKTAMQGCPCCTDFLELRRLSLTPLLDLGRAELESYSWDAIWTVGNESDYRHFTPRLLELMVREDAFEPEVVAKKLIIAGWRNWSQVEQSAIEKFFSAYWDSTLLIDSAWYPASDALCVLGNAFDDLKPFLARWLATTEPTALKQLVQFAKSGYSNAFWSDRQEQMQQAVAWLHSPETLAVLEDRWLADPDGPLARLLNEAVELLTPAVCAADTQTKKDN
jgi:hypothetical protein